jgi:short-subunit dehydrogenase
MTAGSFRDRYGPWGLVTGASSGIGAEFARQLARLELDVVLVARRLDRLRALEREISQAHGIRAVAAPVDLADADFLTPLQQFVGERTVGLLVNAAGFAVTGALVEQRLQRQLDLLSVNCRAPLVLAHHFGQQMAARRRGGIIFVASTTAYIPTPLWAGYSSSKAYDRFLGQALAAELRPRGVDVLVLCPGFTRTEFLASAGVQPGGALSAEAVVRQALRDLGHHVVVVPGALNRLATLLARIAPEPLAVALAGRVIARVRRDSPAG